MDHLAIMRKSWGLTEKILSGKKRIESRWYLNRACPWDRISPGETVYFKDFGEPVRIKAEVDKVIQIPNLTPQKVREILDTYWQDDGIAAEDIPKFYDMFKDKRYCLLILLKNPQKVEPFMINKKGYGMMAAWIAVEHIDQIRKK